MRLASVISLTIWGNQALIDLEMARIADSTTSFAVDFSDKVPSSWSLSSSLLGDRVFECPIDV